MHNLEENLKCSWSIVDTNDVHVYSCSVAQCISSRESSARKEKGERSSATENFNECRRAAATNERARVIFEWGASFALGKKVSTIRRKWREMRKCK